MKMFVGLIHLVFALNLNAGPDHRLDVTWNIYQSNLKLDGWHPRIAILGSAGWIGAGLSNTNSRESVYQLDGQGRWQVDPQFPVVGQRTLLDLDHQGRPWVCNFDQREETTYGGLRIDYQDGSKWCHDIVEPGIWPQTMDMLTATEGWIGGNHGLLLHYTGGNWKHTRLDHPRENQNILHLKMKNESEGWLVGCLGLVSQFRNGRWHVLPVPDWLKERGILALDFTKDDTLYFVGENGLAGSFDGSSWRLLETGTSWNLQAISMLSENDGWAVGEQGTILRFDGTRWHPQASPTKTNLSDVAMISNTEGWIIGTGVILKTVEPGIPLLHNTSASSRYPMTRHFGSFTASEDLDNDGHQDLFLLSRDRTLFFKNNGDGSFQQIPVALGMEWRGIQSVAFGDVDRDGLTDLFLVGKTRLQLFRNQGGFQWREVTQKSGIKQVEFTAAQPQFIDLDLDGDLDLYLVMSGYSGQRNLRYTNNGLGVFTEVGCPIERKGKIDLSLWGDLNGDHYPDVLMVGYTAYETSLLCNDGLGQFTDKTQSSGIVEHLGEGVFSQGNLLDLDLDGDLDITLLGDDLYFFINDGDGRFTRDHDLFHALTPDPDSKPYLGNVGDLDHDGYPEILLQVEERGLPRILLLTRKPGGGYRDIADEMGISQLPGDSVVLSDWDSDGDLDLYMTSLQSQLSLMMENTVNNHDYLKIRLHGSLSQGDARGAEIKIYEAGHLGELDFLKGYQQAGMGLNPSGTYNLQEQHFGLANPSRYDVAVRFPSGRTVSHTSVIPGQTLQVYEHPFGIRHLMDLSFIFRQIFQKAEVRGELLHLLLYVILLTSWRIVIRSRYDRFVLFKQSQIWLLASLIYVLMTGCRLLTTHPLLEQSWLPYAFFGGPLLLTTALGFLELFLIHWKNSRYLGHFRLGEVLGEGGMASVYKARDVASKKNVALKVFHAKVNEEQDCEQRLFREAKTLTQLSHPHIIEIYEAGMINDRGYISMELVKGVSLKQHLQEKGPLAPSDLIPIIDSVCSALAYIHEKNIIHRDIKGENIMLQSNGNDALGTLPTVKLTDFGLAKSEEMMTVTRPFSLLGTLAYMSPEQLRCEQLSHLTDIYSLGVVMYEALTGQCPFRADDEKQLLQQIRQGRTPGFPSHLDDYLVALVTKMMAPNPARRFSSINAVREALQDIPQREGAAETTPVNSIDPPQQLEPVRDPLGPLLEISSQVAMTDFQEIIALIMNHILSIAGVQRALLLLQDGEGKLRFEHVIQSGGKDSEDSISISNSIVNQAIDSGGVVLVADVPFSPINKQESIVRLALKAVMAIPLKTMDRVLGVIYVDTDSHQHQLSTEQITLFNAIGSQAALAIENEQLHQKLKRQVIDEPPLPELSRVYEGIVYQGQAMHRVCQTIDQISKGDMTVLLEGETGTGKDVVAHAIHRRGPRRKKKMLSINAGAMPEQILESELFGHRRGAFSGALEHKPGLFETANGGTVFLDEIGEASPAMQVRLLRFLETGTFRRVGETFDRSTDVRIIAATNRDLVREIAAGRFREDLYFRLSVFPIKLPPLRDRREDIPVLVRHFVDRYNHQLKKKVSTISRDILDAMQQRSWRGNVRELSNAVYRMVALASSGRPVNPDQVFQQESGEKQETPIPDTAGFRTLAEVERDYMRLVLAKVGGNQTQAARVLGLHRNTFRSRMKKAGLLA